MSNLPILFKRLGLKNPFFESGDMTTLEHVFEDFDRFFGPNCYTNEDGDCIYMIEVPGFNKDNLSVELSDGILTIKGDREVKDKHYAGNSKIFKQLTVGEAEDATAKIEDGILTLTVKYPKPEPGKQITVE